MRLVLAVCLSLVCGESFGAIEAYFWRRQVGVSLVGPDYQDRAIYKQNDLVAGWAAMQLTFDRTNGGAPFYGTSTLDAVLSSTSLHAQGSTATVAPGGYVASASASLNMFFRVTDTGVEDSISFNFSGVGFDRFTLSGPSGSLFNANAGSGAFVLAPGVYQIALRAQDSTNSTHPFDLQVDFSSLAFAPEGEFLDTEMVPEASSVATWALLGIAFGCAYWRRK